MSLEPLTKEEVKSADWSIFCVKIGASSIDFVVTTKDNKHKAKFTTHYPDRFLSMINKVTSPKIITHDNLPDYLSGRKVQLHALPDSVMVHIGPVTGVYLGLKEDISISRNY